MSARSISGYLTLMLWLAPIAWAQPNISVIIERIEHLYESIDAVMISAPYQTITEVQRRDEAKRIEETQFNPTLPAGEREMLLRVNGHPPTATELRQFNRRPQPDDRDSQPIRLKIPYAELELTSEQEQTLVFQFTPLLRLDNSISDHGALFQGELTWDKSQNIIREVRIRLKESFRYSIFQVHQFTVHETFLWVDKTFKRQKYHHDIELRNFWLDLSNKISIQFDYSNLE